MSELSIAQPPAPASDHSVFTIVAGTTVPDRAALVRAECREGAPVELRRLKNEDADGSLMDVWVECKSLLGMLKVWKKIGHVPKDAATSFQPIADATSSVVAHGTVKSVYAPAGRDEAVVTVILHPKQPRPLSS